MKKKNKIIFSVILLAVLVYTINIMSRLRQILRGGSIATYYPNEK